MADIEARREARRRKILENSQTRLSRITGVQSKTDINCIDGYVSAIPTVIESTSSNHIEQHSHHPQQNDIQTIYQNSSYDSNNSIGGGLVIGERTEIINSRFSIIVAIAIVLSFCLAFFKPIEVYFNNIFIPLLAYELIDLVIGNQNNSDGNWSSLLLLLPNNNAYRSYLKYLKLFVKVMEDIMLYFFTFICCYHILLYVF